MNREELNEVSRRLGHVENTMYLFKWVLRELGIMDSDLNSYYYAYTSSRVIADDFVSDCLGQLDILTITRDPNTAYRYARMIDIWIKRLALTSMGYDYE